MAKQIKKLEQQMFKHAQDLEFEKAAAIRDQIAEMKELASMGSSNVSVTVSKLAGIRRGD